MSLYFLLLKTYKEKDSDSSSWVNGYEDIVGVPLIQWPCERKEELEQFEDTIGKDKVQEILEETTYFLIFFMVNCCGPYVLKGEVKKLLDRFYKAAFTGWTPISPRDSYNKYASSCNPLEKFSMELITILDENIFTGAKMAIEASGVARNIKSSIDKFFKEPHQFGLD